MSEPVSLLALIAVIIMFALLVKDPPDYDDGGEDEHASQHRSGPGLPHHRGSNERAHPAA